MLTDYICVPYENAFQEYKKRLARKMIQEELNISIQGQTKSFLANFYLENSRWNYFIKDLQIAVGPFDSLLDAIITARADVADFDSMETEEKRVDQMLSNVFEQPINVKEVIGY